MGDLTLNPCVGHGLFQGHLDFSQRGDGHPQRQLFVQHMVFAHIAVRQHVVAQLLGVAQPGAVAQHDPGMWAQHGDVVGDVFGIGRADADVDHADAAAVRPQQVVTGHLRFNWNLTLIPPGDCQAAGAAVCANGQQRD